jgi:ABC-type Mn2+/Zn2+ transport system ATPase subunit
LEAVQAGSPLIWVEGLAVSYGSYLALSDIDLVVSHPTVTAILGPNGAGKTTLLKVLLGLVKPSRGHARVLGHDPVVEAHRIRPLVGYVPQRERLSLAFSLRVRDVVLMGLLAKKPVPRHTSRQDEERAREALRVVGMEGFWDQPFNTLSGGQQQRVLLARSVVRSPRLLLLDEPLSGVDVSTQAHVAEFLAEMRAQGVSTIIVTHDINPVGAVADLVVLLNRRIVAVGPPKEVLKPSLLAEIYGPGVRVVDQWPCPLVFTGDTHG